MYGKGGGGGGNTNVWEKYAGKGQYGKVNGY